MNLTSLFRSLLATVSRLKRGDLLVYYAGEFRRLGRGTIGQVLTSTPSAVAGLSWETPSGGGGGLTSPVGVADGGTGATTKAGARAALDLEYGVDVQVWDADLDLYAGVTPSAFTLSLLDEANAGAWRTALGSVIGTNVQAYDSDLDLYAGVTPSAFTLSVLDETSASAWRTALGLAIGSNVQAWDADLDSYAGVPPSAFTLSLLDETTAAAWATGLGLGTTDRPTFQGVNLVGGGLKVPVRAASSTTTLTGADYYLSADATAGGFTVNLPAVATSTGWVFEIKNVGGANNVTLDGNSTELIDGTQTKVLGVGAATRLICTGSKWESR